MWYRRFKGDYPRKDKPEGVRELEKVSSAHHIAEKFAVVLVLVAG